MAAHPLLYLMILPVLAYFLVYHYYPMYGMIISFFDYVPTKGITGSSFVGLKHFKAFLEDPYFFRTMRNTLSINLLLLIFGFPFPIIFAVLLNELRSAKFRKVTQTITYMPHFISTVVICGLMLDFCKSRGVITTIFSAISGNDPVNLFSQSAYFQPLYEILHITIPGISPTIIILLIMRIGNMMTLGWDKILLLSANAVSRRVNETSLW